ncbi:cobyrinate a,c-diamide synthase [Alicyclobacillus tolerans]|uniref:cobyrinate a,c-diamide synthase n=1 Tax=Alicyclobacillus tolerans TaxID=90970 RepID=UPI003B75E102
MRQPRIVIAGTQSGAGKTTVTLGLMAALRRRKLQVQGFKVGPDYIDPSYHSVVTGRVSRNLDTWMMTPSIVQEVFERGSRGSDISVIEGVMGMYDGKDPLSNLGSTAEMSCLLKAPVLLVLNVSSMARSAAAMVLGFQKLDPDVPLAGVIVNQVGSVGHFELVKTAIEQMCGIPVVGYLGRHTVLQIPERHLGLIPALERGEMSGLFDALADAIEATVDVDSILKMAQEAEELPSAPPVLFAGKKREPLVTIAIAKDSAFNFYYPENLELLEWYGARLVEFSPLRGEKVPENADGVYIGGGFPEEFAAELSRQEEVRQSLQRALQNGLPVFAECGGYMYLTGSIKDRQGAVYDMTGAIPASVEMQPKLAALGYREVTALQDTLLLSAGEHARGHEFHYSTIKLDINEQWPFAYESSGMRGKKTEGYAKGNLLAAYTHLHFASNPRMVERFITACRRYRKLG